LFCKAACFVPKDFSIKERAEPVTPEGVRGLWITKDREQIVNETFVKIMDELGYDVELTYKKRMESNWPKSVLHDRG